MSAPATWSVASLDIISSLCGETIIEHLATHGLTLRDVHDKADKALGGRFCFQLLENDKNVMEMSIGKVRGPLMVVKLREKVNYSSGDILEEMNEMPGSQNCSQFQETFDDDLDQLSTISLAEFNHKLFGLSEGSQGYRVQARMLELHSIFNVRSSEPPTKAFVLQRLRDIDREAAIAMLIGLHNDGKIQLSRHRFEPLARDLGIQLR
jgi:hypothetical protein